ncbi:hypothetical protein Patl1_01720 [Pistacia atlantica]|uniref:Uncharacterized protein n=1 Tax=Pistacia atlantica TaxID=434234 RepID=A0ACC1CAT4_9ROSI|nr:hypothetical protein Patl1_01720 [Pistacia atlantica]
MERRRLESVYVMSAESAYVDKTRRNETVDLWHMRLGHVSYSKLSMMMKKSMLKGFPQLDVRTDTLATFKYLAVYVMYLFLIIYGASLTRKLLDVSLWDTTTREKGGNVAIQQVEDATLHEMWCSMKHLLSGPLRRRCCQAQENLKTSCNKRWGSILFNFNQVQMNKKIQMAMMSNKE